MVSLPPDDSGEEAGALDIRERMEKFENDARKAGLYLEGFHAGSAGEITPDGQPVPGQMFVMVHLLVGDVAFSDRQMNPEKHVEDNEFRKIAAAEDPYDAIRAEMEARIERGEDPLGEDFPEVKD